LGQSIFNLALCSLYLANIGSLIWARFFFFKIKSKVSRRISYLNDPAVAVQIIFTCYYFYTGEVSVIAALCCALLYATSLALFWWSIKTAGKLDFAAGSNPGSLLTKGPYAIARHPFYLSYSAIWITSTLLWNDLTLWVSLTVLLYIYVSSAKAEENEILQSVLSNEYIEYKKTTGMFWPKFSKHVGN